MLSVSRTCFNEFLSLLDVAWVNKVLLLLLLLLSILQVVIFYFSTLWLVFFIAPVDK